MNKIEIEVPFDIKYISEWNDFNTNLLKGHSIINKTITGCGFTHYCLTNSIPTILCSPRKFLLENKHEQLPNTYLVVNSNERGLSIDGDDLSTKVSNSLIKNIKEQIKELKKETEGLNEKAENFSNIKSIQDNLRSYIFNCQVSNIAPKILVTYDSLGYILSVLGETIKYYSVIVDEFQNIFMDASFKPDTELNFVNTLQSCPNVTYLSATPYIEEYLNELDEFKLLPYYELKWHPDRLQTIKVDMRKTYHISQDIDKIIHDYLLGKFPEKVDENGIVHQSKEVIFYTNSVKLITSTVIRNNLTPDQVNIICADTEKNKKALEKAFLFRGKAPLRGESHKMFTFCTRTTYAGADFYSTNALSVIISDCKIDSLATDIRMDFPQIMGRQRLKENVFRDECIFIYKLSDESVTMKEFNEISKRKLLKSEADAKTFQLIVQSGENLSLLNLLEDLRLRVKIKKYSEDYTGIDEKSGQLCINKLVYLAEKRAFELRSDVYKSDVFVYNEFARVDTSGISFDETIQKREAINEVRAIFQSKGSFENKMRVICSLLLDPKWYGKIHISDLGWLPLNYRNCLNYLGPEKIRAKSYYEAELKREIQLMKTGGDTIKLLFIDNFIVGNRYTLKEIKETVKFLYSSNNIYKTAKATDILEFFEVRECLITEKDSGKRVKGYEFLKTKE